MSAQRVLVTGGAGFIGSHLTELLLADGCEVWALDDLSTGSRDNVAHLLDDPRYHLVVDTVLSHTVVNELVNKADVVYHLAAAVGPRLIVERPVHTIVTNLEGSEIVLDHCARFEKRVLVASTSEVYGDHRSPEPLREDARRVYGPTTQKRWLYADSKAMDEYLALAYRQERGLNFVIPRLFNTVGPRQSGQYGMVVARFAQAAVAGLPLEIHGDGTQTRTFCHVRDTIRALKGLMESEAGDRRDLQRRLAQPHLGRRAGERACSSSQDPAPRSSTSRTTRSTGSGSTTCSTASRRSRRSATRSAGSPSTTSTASCST